MWQVCHNRKWLPMVAYQEGKIQECQPGTLEEEYWGCSVELYCPIFARTMLKAVTAHPQHLWRGLLNTCTFEVHDLLHESEKELRKLTGQYCERAYRSIL